MKILFLSNSNAEYLDQIPNFLRYYNDDIITLFRRVTINDIKKIKPDFIVSDRYQFIITNDIIELMNGRAINLHPSYLPWNKGYHPNFWSIYNQTITGVSIHQIDSGIDTGKIICQRKVSFNYLDTLKTSYYKSRTSIVNMLFENWNDIRNENIKPFVQKGTGSHHYKKEFDKVWPNIKNGWDTTIEDIKKIKKEIEKK